MISMNFPYIRRVRCRGSKYFIFLLVGVSTRLRLAQKSRLRFAYIWPFLRQSKRQKFLSVMHDALNQMGLQLCCTVDHLFFAGKRYAYLDPFVLERVKSQDSKRNFMDATLLLRCVLLVACAWHSLEHLRAIWNLWKLHIAWRDNFSVMIYEPHFERGQFPNTRSFTSQIHQSPANQKAVAIEFGGCSRFDGLCDALM